ncbi:SRPBCC family protein [Streptomyces yaizuensis]|uniref:SRPBCC family protein n=1 Tax=Streptomyces yaizuensis TaxID=2989713 RepID=A0ABQ5P0E9_9ACTN|nr:SRPBCC family protein [Streptomyces sp. YSPA8]GLF95918.1 SRPBCC family protein [Streptomyces sp. YSPA8]
MDHEVFVPAPADAVRQVLSDPARLARCVQGLKPDPTGAGEPVSGRLRIRAGGHTVTYRGTLSSDADGDAFTVRGAGTEVRGAGTVALELTIRPAAADGGTNLSITGTATVDGRLAQLSPTAREQAAHRLLDRFGERLAEEAIAPAGSADGAGAAVPAPGPGPDGPRSDTTADTADLADTSAAADGGDTSAPDGDGTEALPELPALDGLPDLDELSVLRDGPPAEAAHARRTMIGRSAEEVDHAPPRGRYAPVPAPDPDGGGLPLHWLAPAAAALAVASAVVIGRALRRRR